MGPVIRAIKQAGQSIESVHDAVYQTDQNVQTLLAGIENLTEAFNHFALNQQMHRRYELAVMRVAEIKKELNESYGAYEEVRKTAAKVLKSLADGETETARELLVTVKETAPGYWLTHCLNALSAWLGDHSNDANKSLNEALHLNSEKTMLFFILFNQKHTRRGAAIDWVDKYLMQQDLEKPDKETTVILNAYRTGKFGMDADGVLAKRFETGPNQLNTSNDWRNRFLAMRPNLSSDSYPLMQKHSPMWPALKEAMETANLHGVVLEYLTEAFNQNNDANGTATLTNLLDDLISGFDDAEQPLHEKILYEQQIINGGGIEQRVKTQDNKNETPDAALTVALNRLNVADAYRDIVQSAYIPERITINVNAFSASTDGTDEIPLLDQYYRSVEADKKAAMQQVTPHLSEAYGLYAGGVLGLLGFILLLAVSGFVGLFIIILGGVAVSGYFISKKNITHRHHMIEKKYEHERETGIPILRALITEAHGFQTELEEAQTKSVDVLDLISNIHMAPPASSAPRKRKAKPSADAASAKGFPAWDLLPPE